MIMNSISYTAVRSNLAKTMEQVCDDHAPIAITRKGEGAVVMISMEDYQALEETAYLLKSPKNTRRLVAAIAELEDGKGQEKKLIEVTLIFAQPAWDDYLYWQKTDKKIVNRINTLVREIQRKPFEGIGKPEPLKHALSGYWSRRIDEEHRIVYKIENNAILIAQLRYYY